MTLPVFSAFLRVRWTVVAVVTALGWAVPSPARAAEFNLDNVAAGDMYAIEVVGFNTSSPSGNIYAIAPTLLPTFSTTQTFPNSALGDQTLTVTSSEATSNGVTTDTITISVPTNFIPVGTLDNNNNPVNALAFSIGNYYGATNTLDFNAPVNAYTASGTVTYNLNNTPATASLTQNPFFGPGNTAYSNAEAVQTDAGTPSIATYKVTSFTMVLSYAAVPEPSATAAVLLGVGAVLGTVVRRHRARA